MSDLIDREAAWEITAKLHSEFITIEQEEILERIDEMIEQLPSAQPEQRWIPCKDAEPEEYGEYRITWTTSWSPKQRLIGDAEYEVTGVWDAEHDRFKGEWLLADYIKNYPDVKVLAWKPLEEPYREGEQNE